MWRSKKFIVITALAAVLLTGTIGGVVYAQTANGDEGQLQAQGDTLLERVLEIYQEKTGVAIDQEVLKDSFAQAQSEMRDKALENRLQSLVDEGKIEQDVADQYLEWWQSKPEGPFAFGFGGHAGPIGRFGFHGGGGLCPLPNGQ